MKILNLFAGLGGNRRLWGAEHEVTAVELNPDIAKVYKSLYPQDNVIIGDAHQYLLDHFKEFDMIWTSPHVKLIVAFATTFVSDLETLNLHTLTLGCMRR